MKVLLISPPFYRILGFYNRYFPFGVTLLGSILKENGYQVTVYDADCYVNPESIDYSQLPSKYPSYLKSFNDKNNKVWKEVRNLIRKEKPDVIGISVFTTFAASAFNVAKIAKEIIPKAKVVFGGPHAFVRAKEILEICKNVDYVVSGDGEDALLALLENIKLNKPKLESILGLSFRKSGKIVSNQARPMVRDIDRFPIPDRSLLMNKKKYTSEDMGLIMTSRGCPYRCSYCASTKGLVYRSIDSVIKEIESVIENYGTTQFTFKDDSFTVDKRRVKELCEKLAKKKIKIKWECNTRVNLIDKELLVMMKKAGCNFIKVGIESGSEKVLKIMNKGITKDQCREAAKILKQSGIHWTGYFMMGVVGEHENDIYETLDFVKELKPDLALIGVYEPFPGTEMFEGGIKRGLVNPKMSMKQFLTINPNDYYKKDPNLQSDVIDQKRFLEIEEEVKKVFRDYNMRMENIWSMAYSKIAVYFKEPRIFMEDINKFRKYIVKKDSNA